MQPVSSRPSLADEVHERLVEAVCSGDLPPGTLLRQEKLAEELQVSRQPIIQALGLLRRDGLVEPAGRRGYQVAAVTVDLVRQVYDIRRALDGLAAQLAAERPEDIRRNALKSEEAAGAAALNAGNIPALVEADTAFHRATYHLADNAFLMEASAAVWRQSRRVMHAVLETKEIRGSVWDEHAEIAKAVRLGDGETARHLAEAHVANASLRLRRWMGAEIHDEQNAEGQPMQFGSVLG